VCQPCSSTRVSGAARSGTSSSLIDNAVGGRKSPMALNGWWHRLALYAVQCLTGASVQIICIRWAMFLCMVLAWSPPSGVGMPKERQDNPKAQPKAPRPAAQPSEPVKPMRVGGEVSAPKLISRPKHWWPNDPTQCYQLGVAAFEGVVDKNGNIKELRLIKGPDNEFSRAAREAIAAEVRAGSLSWQARRCDVSRHDQSRSDQEGEGALCCANRGRQCSVFWSIRS
jgi:hypothetical protein